MSDGAFSGPCSSSIQRPPRLDLSTTMRGKAVLLSSLSPFLLRPVSVRAQGSTSEHGSDEAAPSAWSWTADGNLFFGYNYQLRPFADYSAWESQNWLMGSGTRQLGAGHVPRDALARAVHHARGGLAATLPDGRKLSANPTRQFSAPARSVDGLGHDLPAAKGALDVPPRAISSGSPTLGPRPFMHRNWAHRQPTGAADPPLSRFDSHHRRSLAGRRRDRVGDNGIVRLRGAGPDRDRLDVEEHSSRLAGRRGHGGGVGPGRCRYPGGVCAS